MKYRELKNYKYQLVEGYSVKIEIHPLQNIYEPNAYNPLLKLSMDGTLTIFAGYCWDGPSGPTVDSKNFMRGSLVHDALYQLIRQNKLNPVHRDYADELLYQICIEDGMSKFRAKYVFQSVQWFGKSAASPTDKKEMQEKILEAP